MTTKDKKPKAKQTPIKEPGPAPKPVTEKKPTPPTPPKQEVAESPEHRQGKPSNPFLTRHPPRPMGRGR